MGEKLVVNGVEVDRDVILSWIGEELELHKTILGVVKRYYDDMLRSLGVDPAALAEEDPSTYYALLLELTRSVYISVQNRVRSLRPRR